MKSSIVLLALSAAAHASDENQLSTAPMLTYFGIAGRGELARLYCVVGDVDFVDSIVTTDYKTKTPIGYLPAVSHPEAGLFPACKFAYGCLQESLAVERYLAMLSPKFNTLTAQERAIDDMVAMIKEDLIHVEHAANNATLAPSVVNPLYDRYLNVLEHDGYVPASGFINGKSYPTGADLAVLVLLKSEFPYAKALKTAKYDTSRFPKVVALAERTAAYPAVAAYLNVSRTFYKDLP